METVAQTPENDELQFLTVWGTPDDRTRTGKAGVLSILAHAAAITFLALLPRSVLEAPRKMVHSITPLVEPLTEPTQTTPNKGKVSKEFNAEALQPRPRIQIPPSPPSTTRPAAIRPAVQLPPVQAQQAPPALPEPPKAEAAPPPVQIAQAPLLPQPQIQPQEIKPKSPFENPSSQPPVQGGGVGRVAAPNTSVSEAIRGAIRGGGGGLTVGDAGEGIGGIGEGVNLPPSPGRQGSSLELLSDPMGVDFRPYLIKILAAVRRN